MTESSAGHHDALESSNTLLPAVAGTASGPNGGRSQRSWPPRLGWLYERSDSLGGRVRLAEGAILREPRAARKRPGGLSPQAMAMGDVLEAYIASASCP